MWIYNLHPSFDEDKNNVLKDRLKGLKNKTNVNLEEISKDIRKDENELYQIKIGLIFIGSIKIGLFFCHLYWVDFYCVI